MSPPHLIHRRRALVALLVLAGVVVLGLGPRACSQQGAHAQAAATDGGALANDRVVPVRVAPVQLTDLPITIEGLGSAVAFATVTVKAQVDGRLESMAFREGQPVKKGELLAQIDARPFLAQVHQAQAALNRDQANLKNAQLNLDRNEELLAKKLVAPQQRDDQRAAVEQLQAVLELDRAQLESAQLQLGYARVVSPIEGVTGVRLVDPGNIVHPADPSGLVVVTRLDPIAVLFSLPQDDLPRVTGAMAQGPLQVEAYSRDGATLLGQGELQLIDNQINPGTATLRLKAVLPNPNHLLWPNQFVRARLRLGVRQRALVVPAAAVQTGPSGAFVYLVDEGNIARVRPVKVELVQGDQAVIGSGLAPGDSVVVEGQNQLRPDARVSTGAERSGPAQGPGAPGPKDGAGPKAGAGPRPDGAPHAGHHPGTP